MKAIFSLKIALIFYLTTYAQGYKIGEHTSDFRLMNVDGEIISMKDFPNAKGFILIFTCNHCPYSKAYESRIIELDKKYREKGYPVIAINPNDPEAYPEDSFENMQKIAKEKGYTFPYLFDESQNTAKRYGATKTPHVFVVRKVSNQYVLEYSGAIDDNSQNISQVKKKYVEDAVEELLANKKVTQHTTKAIGCSIKWKAKKSPKN
ncbi:MAG: thioredoxin family protein [Cytophagales bacterium]|nr:thioredoxin family protein [Cytophagales bacterium]MDW8384910.1 thioredoxin family protein [Flammeovirgaceae bacterium]